MKKVYVVNQCDRWKSYDSFRLVGIFTNRKKLNPVLNKFLKDQSIEWDDEECTDRFVNKLTDRELQDELRFIYIELVALNELQ